MSSDFNLPDHLPCCVFSFNSEGTISYVNQFLLQQLKYTDEELTGKSVEKLLTLSSRIFYQTHFLPLLTLQGNINEVFLTLKSKNSVPVPVLVNATKTKIDTGFINICVCMIVDKRKKYEDEILEAKKVAEAALQKNELLQKTQYELEHNKQELDKQLTLLKYTNEELLQLNEIVTHDLQEPLRKINLHVSMIETKEPEIKQKYLSHFNIIVKSAGRMRLLLVRLQNYLPVLTEPIKKSTTDLNEIVQNQLDIVKKELPELILAATFTQLPVIVADCKQMNVLFYELIKNTVMFRSPERELCLTVSSTLVEENIYSSLEGKYNYKEFARITVSDNGLGFNPSYKEHIFKLLKKIYRTEEGLGFGLAFCKRITENHGGNIKAFGEENKGATFTIMLPVN